jgi:hypothetical protein
VLSPDETGERNRVSDADKARLLGDACLPASVDLAPALLGGGSAAGAGAPATYHLRGVVIATGEHFQGYRAQGPDNHGRWAVCNDTVVEPLDGVGAVKLHMLWGQSRARPVLAFYEAADGVSDAARTAAVAAGVTACARPQGSQAAPLPPPPPPPPLPLPLPPLPPPAEEEEDADLAAAIWASQASCAEDTARAQARQVDEVCGWALRRRARPLHRAARRPSPTSAPVAVHRLLPSAKACPAPSRRPPACRCSRHST